jgi:peptidoglycan/LPS O-acetylase OafA/YrhL
MTKEKIYYIDNLRVLLTALVVLHHSFVTYGAPGGWLTGLGTEKKYRHRHLPNKKPPCML